MQNTTFIKMHLKGIQIFKENGAIQYFSSLIRNLKPNQMGH